MKIAIYARVSKDDGIQDVENQLILLREFCKDKGWTVTREYIDRESAKTDERAQFVNLFADASKRKFKLVLVWALDRFMRSGIGPTFAAVDRLKQNGVDFWSYSEEFFRTMGPAGQLMFAIAAWVAEQERKRISDRTKAGLARVRASGTVLGRREVAVNVIELRRLREEKLSVRDIAGRMGLKRAVVHKALMKLGAAIAN